MVKRLDDDIQVRIVEMRAKQDLGLFAIATALGISTASVNKYLKRAEEQGLLPRRGSLEVRASVVSRFVEKKMSAEAISQELGIALGSIENHLKAARVRGFVASQNRAEIHAAVLAMYVEQGLRPKTISQRLNISLGAINKHLENAYVVRTRKRREGQSGVGRFSDEVEQEIAAKYADGASREALCKEYACTAYPVRAAIVNNGGTMRPRGNKTRLFTAEQMTEMERLWASGMSQAEIGRRFGAGQTIISKAMRLHGVETEQRRPTGEAHGSWKGGRTVNRDGYVSVRIPPDHPFASMRNVGGYVMEHRLVMAQKLGRPLTANETVHHKGTDKSDNSPNNLQLRQGRHGKHQAFCCADCGSRNIVPIPLDDAG